VDLAQALHAAGRPGRPRRLEVVVATTCTQSRRRGRSAPLEIDGEGPNAPRIETEAADHRPDPGHGRAVGLNATQAKLDGDFVKDAATAGWFDLVDSVDVQLIADEGGQRVLRARFRDGAPNESDEVADSIWLALGPGPASRRGATGRADGHQERRPPRRGRRRRARRRRGERAARDVATGATAQPVPADGLTIDASGKLSGSIVASGLTDGSTVALEVVLHARNRDSDAAASRSSPGLTVDLTPPGDLELTAARYDVADPAVVVSAVASGAARLFLTGDLEPGANVRTWLPYDPTAVQQALSLSGGDGPKVVLARFRDGAGNEAEVTRAFTLDRTVPTSAPTLTVQRLPGKAKGALQRRAGGARRLQRSLPRLGAPPGPGRLRGRESSRPPAARTSPTQVQSWAAAFTGTVSGKPCEAAASAVALEAVVESRAGLPSVASSSRSDPIASTTRAPLVDLLQLEREARRRAPRPAVPRPEVRLPLRPTSPTAAR
jgi:hypothetical protein